MKKVKGGPIDGPTYIVTYRVACTRLKKPTQKQCEKSLEGEKRSKKAEKKSAKRISRIAISAEPMQFPKWLIELVTDGRTEASVRP